MQQEVASRPTVEETTFDLPVVSPHDPPIIPLGYSPTTYIFEKEISMSIFDAQKPNLIKVSTKRI